MEYQDLHIFPEDHPPSPYDHPVRIIKIGDGWLPKGLRLCAIGWIEKPGFPTGQVSNECIDALVAGYPSKIFSDGTRGVHSCTLCNQSIVQMHWKGQTVQLKGYGHYLIQMEETVYIAPALLLHYICEHHYCPPQEFVYATVHGKFLTEEDLDIKWKDKNDW
ncbi:MAG: hypothetical protein GY832_10260 [Chloroflexi bacterium]|nr:hypothetical protein [Chloroflexota bacterium]